MIHVILSIMAFLLSLFVSAQNNSDYSLHQELELFATFKPESNSYQNLGVAETEFLSQNHTL